MAAITTAPSERFNFGPLVARSYDLTGVNDNDTLVVPLIRIVELNIMPTTATAVGATIVQGATSATLTLRGTFSGKLWVVGREG